MEATDSEAVQVPGNTRTSEFRVHGVDVPFVGRKDALDGVWAGLRDALSEQRLVVCSVAGASGLGKSRLLFEVRRRLRHTSSEIRVYAVRCAPDGELGACSVAAQILRQRFSLPPVSGPALLAALERSLEPLVAAPKRPEAVLLLAHLLDEPVPVESRSVSWDHETIRRRAHATFSNLLRFDSTRRSHVFVLDDWHRSGSTTRALMPQLLAALANGPVGVVLAGEDMAEFSVPDLRMIRLGTVDSSVLEQAVAGAMGFGESLPDGLREATVGQCEGSPGLLVSLLRVLIQTQVLVSGSQGWEYHPPAQSEPPAPQTVRSVAKVRVSALGVRERFVLECAAVQGTEFYFRAVLRMMRMTRRAEDEESLPYWRRDRHEARLNATLLEMQGMDLVEFVSEPAISNEVSFRFINAVEQQRLYSEMDPERRARLHRAYADWLGDLKDHASAIEQWRAWHYERGGRPVQGATCLRTAATRYAQAFNKRRAVDLLDRAGELLDVSDAGTRCRIHHEQFDLLLQLGDQSAADRVVRQSLFESVIVDDKTLGGHSWLRYGRLGLLRGEWFEADAGLATALELYQGASCSSGIADALDERGRLALYRGAAGAYDEAILQFAKAVSIRRQLDDRSGVAVTLGNMGNIYLSRGQFEKAHKCYSEAWTHRLATNDPHGLALTAIGMGAVHYEAGRYDDALGFWSQGLEAVCRVGDRELEGILANNMAEACLARGDVDAAGAHLTRAATIAADVGDRRTSADILRNKARLAARRGHDGRANELIAEAVHLATEVEARSTLAYALRTRAELEMASGRWLRVAEPLAEATRLFREMGDVLGEWKCLNTQAVFAEHSGRHDEAQRCRTAAKRLFTSLE